jgi:hypothetical protein
MDGIEQLVRVGGASHMGKLGELVLAVDIREPVRVMYDEAGVGLLDRPRRGKAAANNQ